MHRKTTGKGERCKLGEDRRGPRIGGAFLLCVGLLLVPACSFAMASFTPTISLETRTRSDVPAPTDRPAWDTPTDAGVLPSDTPIPPTDTPLAPTITLPLPSNTPFRNTSAPRPVAPPAPSTLAEFFARCPTAQEVDFVRASFTLSFKGDPTTGTLACTKAAGSADLTLLEKRAYQTVMTMRYIEFDAPLPWTEKALFDWFAETITGIRFRDDIPNSYCCGPLNTINIRVAANSFLVLTDDWVDPQSGGGLMDALVLYVHEARHNEGFGHMCNAGNDDRTVSEMGAWGVQFYVLEWMAQHSDRDFFLAPGSDPDLYRRTALDQAYLIRNSRFCDEPPWDPAPTLSP
jgi:hypothetical protein